MQTNLFLHKICYLIVVMKHIVKLITFYTEEKIPLLRPITQLGRVPGS
ncbi:hypothetical protein NMT12_90052 [metagenome]